MPKRRSHELTPDGEPYKVYKLLDPLLDKAQKEQSAGYSVDVRIYARRKPNGDLWGEVAFLGRDGRLVALSDTASDAIPLAQPQHVEQYLASIVTRLFKAVEKRGSTDARTERPGSAPLQGDRGERGPGT